MVTGNDFNISFSLLSNPVPLYICIYCIINKILFKLTFYIELSSKAVGVGLNFALLKVNYIV